MLSAANVTAKQHAQSGRDIADVRVINWLYLGAGLVAGKGASQQSVQATAWSRPLKINHPPRAQKILFWFSPETLNPIALYELGTWVRGPKPIFVGVHPDYPRRQDVVIQLELARPEVFIVSTVYHLALQVRMDSK